MGVRVAPAVGSLLVMDGDISDHAARHERAPDEGADKVALLLKSEFTRQAQFDLAEELGVFARLPSFDGVDHIASAPGYQRRSLLEVQDAIARGPDDSMLEEMANNPVADGLVARDAATISGWKAAEGMWQGIKAQVDASLMFLDLPGVRRTLAQTDFDVRDLRRKRKSLYVVIPNKEKESMGRWLRLIYTSVMDQIDAEPGRSVHVIVDEFAALGRFDRVLTDLATLRSAGFRYHIVIQDLNQLNELYGHGWQTIIGNCAVRQCLGVNDNFTAEYLSHALGGTTVQDGWDLQQEFADGPQQKRPRWVARPLRTPSEILGLDRGEMIVLTDRTRPFLLPKCHYFDTSPWSERATDLRQIGPSGAYVAPAPGTG